MYKIYIDAKYKILFKTLNDKIIEIFNYDDFLLDNIYLGRINNIEKSQEAIFVDIGEDKDVYLEYDENLNKLDSILVQIIRESDEKPAKVSREISISNEYFVIFPFEKFTKFSKKLSSQEVKKIKDKFKDFIKTKNFGILFRTDAINLSIEDFKTELLDLIDKSEKIKIESTRLPIPRLLYKINFLDNYIKNIQSDDKIITNDREIYERYSTKNIKYEKDFSIIYNVKFLRDYKKFFKDEVKLEFGGEIVIENTKALCAIDVNSKDYNKIHKSYEDFLYTLNINAADEIVNQIICRNISGIIIIDFLKMKSKKNYMNLKTYVEELFQRDYSITLVYNFTKLGLLEISRKNYGIKLKDKIGD